MFAIGFKPLFALLFSSCSTSVRYNSLWPLASLEVFSIQQKKFLSFSHSSLPVLLIRSNFVFLLHQQWHPQSIRRQNFHKQQFMYLKTLFALPTFQQIAPCFSLSLSLSLASSPNTAFSSTLAPCQSHYVPPWKCHLNSLLSLRIIPDKSNTPPLLPSTSGKKCRLSGSPSSLFDEVQYRLHTIYMWAAFFIISSGTLLPFNFSGYSLLLNPLVTELLTLQCIFKHLIHNHDSQYFHTTELSSKKRYIIVSLLNIFVHLNITLWMFSWKYKFNMMKAVPDFLTWIPYLLNSPGRSYVL